MSNLKEITRKSDWGEWDQLGGETLKDDETLIIEWPDGDLQGRVRALDRLGYGASVYNLEVLCVRLGDAQGRYG